MPVPFLSRRRPGTRNRAAGSGMAHAVRERAAEERRRFGEYLLYDDLRDGDEDVLGPLPHEGGFDPDDPVNREDDDAGWDDA